jgi:hypothetical protein
MNVFDSQEALFIKEYVHIYTKKGDMTIIKDEN